MKKQKLQRGYLIAIEGTDGSGKGTQCDLLYKRLKDEGYGIEVADFPQYGTKSAGPVEEYLNGKYGSAENVGPWIGSMPYAFDRYDASFKIRQSLEKKNIVLSNRYVNSSAGHQGGKIKNWLIRKIFFKWLYWLEYSFYGIPKPDINIILYVDPKRSQELVDKKESREYIKGKKRDIHEDDIEYLRAAAKVYQQIAKTLPSTILINCTKNGQMMSREEINNKIWKIVTNKINVRVNKKSEYYSWHYPI